MVIDLCLCLQELNVRSVTVSSDKKKYGVRLQAEPDFKALGAKLKGAMKSVMTAVKQLSDEQLTKFQQSGTMEVCGITLQSDEVKLKYAFNSNVKDAAASYDAYSDGDVSENI